MSREGSRGLLKLGEEDTDNDKEKDKEEKHLFKMWEPGGENYNFMEFWIFTCFRR